MASNLLGIAKEGDNAILSHFTELVRNSVENKSGLKGLNNI